MDTDSILQSFADTRVLLLGDLMIDQYTWGTIERMSPEAPVPVVRVHKKESRLGGAGNVAINCIALGANTLPVGIIGDDDAGKMVEKLFAKRGLSTEGLLTTPRPTTIKTRVIADDKHVVRVDEEDATYPEDDSDLVNHVVACIESFKPEVIILQDYNKGVLTKDVIANAIAKARELNIPTIVDPKKINFLEYRGVTLFKPNLKEITEGLGIDINPQSASDVDNGVSQLIEKLNAEGVLLTLSEHGVFINFENQKKHIPAFERNIVDVSGAGDTVVSVAALALAHKMSPVDIALIANLGGGLVCEHVGVVPIEPQDLEREYTLHHGK